MIQNHPPVRKKPLAIAPTTFTCMFLRADPIREILEKLRHNGLDFFNETNIHQISTGITQQTIAFTSSR